jgi:hypothetical protein
VIARSSLPTVAVVGAGSSGIAADDVVCCTGYKISFPFFDEGFVSAPDNHIELAPEAAAA